MFERLTGRFQDVFRGLAGRGHLTEKNINEAMGEVRRALLEADVNYSVAKDLVKRIKEECLGEKVLKSVTPGQQVIKVVNDKLAELLGESQAELNLSGKPTVLMLVGLHGSGKTTTASKLALHLKNRHNRKVMLAAGDLYRPAAIHQLEILGKDLDIPVYSDHESKNVVKVAIAAQQQAIAQGCDTLIIDTAGRLQVDTDLVQELIDIRKAINPQEILLVADSALGQEAVSVAKHFNEALNIDGIILTKMDGDARGGAALSMHQVTGKPIKFVGFGEQASDLEPFHPDRMASRILGMGDVLSLVERASEHYQEEEAEKLEEKLRKNRFDFEDFLDQMRRIQKMGGIASLMKFIPGMGGMADKVNFDDKQFVQIEGIICSMTRNERQKPELIDTPRRRRIAKGSGTDLQAVNQLLNQFKTMKKMISGIGKNGLGGLGGLGKMMSGDMDDLLGGMSGGGMPGMPGGMPGMPNFGGGSSAGTTKAKKKPRKKVKKNNAKKKKKKKKK